MNSTIDIGSYIKGYVCIELNYVDSYDRLRPEMTLHIKVERRKNVWLAVNRNTYIKKRTLEIYLKR